MSAQQHQQQLSAVSVDLARVHRRTVTSFYSNLVTRPTGRAVRLGVEQQLAGMPSGGACLSILDFSQVRVMDYSCADEIVAKLLARFREPDRPVEAYFLARGFQDHHLEAIEAVLERHGLLLAAEGPENDPRLLGPATPADHTCWRYLLRAGRGTLDDLVRAHPILGPGAEHAIERLLANRVAVRIAPDWIYPLPRLADG